MVHLKFILRNKSGELPQTIYVTARFGRNDKLMYALPVKCEPVYWDEVRERVKGSMYCSYSSEVNDVLESISNIFRKHTVDVAKTGGSITKESIKELFDVHFGKRKKTDDFHSFFEAYIEECDHRISTMRKGQTLAYKTKREYARTFYYICQYEKNRKVYLNFEDVTQSMITDWVGFMQDLNLSANTIAHKVMTLKATMRAAVERGLTDNQKWTFFRNSTENTDAVALTEEELVKLKELDLSKRPHLDRVRDLFLAGCWTGLRFSDVTRIKKENIKDGVITIRQIKTGAYVAIPVHPVFVEIWEKYGGALPHPISNQKFNKYIKEVCKIACINDTFIKSMTKGGRMETRKCEKWEVVSSHTARRTFATNLYKNGFPSISIMQITGHKTEAAFMRYIKLTKQDHAKLLAEHWEKEKDSNGKNG